MASQLLVFGSTGFLGKTFFLEASPRCVAIGRNRHDFTQPIGAELRNFLNASDAPFAILLTAMSSPDDCRRDPELSEKVNVSGAVAVLKELKARHIKPVFLSSDHIFDGQKGNYLEEDEYCPISLYGRQKVRTETFIRENFTDYLILRTSKQVTMRIDPMNTLSELAMKLRQGQKIRCANDSWMAPSFTEDIVKMTFAALDRGLSGIFNIAPATHYSRLELGYEIAETFEVDRALVEPCSIQDLQFLEVRPPRCTLNGHRFTAALDYQLIPLRQGLAQLRDRMRATQ